jgi:hypothetical protein
MEFDFIANVFPASAFMVTGNQGGLDWQLGSLCDLVEGNISALNAHLMCEAVVGWPISGILFPSVLLATALLLRLIPSSFPCNVMPVVLDSDTLFIISQTSFFCFSLFFSFCAHTPSLSARLGRFPLTRNRHGRWRARDGWTRACRKQSTHTQIGSSLLVLTGSMGTSLHV